MAIDAAHYLGLDYLFNPHKRLYWGYLLSSLVVVGFFSVLTRQAVTHALGKAIWWHPSARLDYIYFVVISIIKLGLLLPWMLSVGEVALWTLRLMETLLGYREKVIVDRFWLVLGYTLVLFLVSDLSRYCLHRLMHCLPFLWAFHKVHHSAEVLTPVTFYRVHPLENILFGLRYALVAGSIAGGFMHFFGANLAVIDVIGVNFFVFAFHLFGANLRHSPIHFGYFDALEKWLISPAQHQHHHTKNGASVNYGGALSVWDRLFGSLRLSRQGDIYHYGLDDDTGFRSIVQLLFKPFTYFTRLFDSKTSRISL